MKLSMINLDHMAIRLFKKVGSHPLKDLEFWTFSIQIIIENLDFLLTKALEIQTSSAQTLGNRNFFLHSRVSSIKFAS